jgi:hypothetical protein
MPCNLYIYYIHIQLQQLGFMPGRGSTNAIFTVLQVIERYDENRKNLHMVQCIYRPRKAYAMF